MLWSASRMFISGNALKLIRQRLIRSHSIQLNKLFISTGFANHSYGNICSSVSSFKSNSVVEFSTISDSFFACVIIFCHRRQIFFRKVIYLYCVSGQQVLLYALSLRIDTAVLKRKGFMRCTWSHYRKRFCLNNAVVLCNCET